MERNSRGPGLSRLASELRRRHVVRTAVTYGAVGFVFLQVAEIVLPAFLPGFEADAAGEIGAVLASVVERSEPSGVSGVATARTPLDRSTLRPRSPSAARTDLEAAAVAVTDVELLLND